LKSTAKKSSTGRSRSSATVPTSPFQNAGVALT
jgi:hypothetical protein